MDIAPWGTPEEKTQMQTSAKSIRSSTRLIGAKGLSHIHFWSSLIDFVSVRCAKKMSVTDVLYCDSPKFL